MGHTGGFGVTFNIGSGPVSGTPTYAAIAQVENFNGINLAAIFSETTHHASPGGWRSHIPSGLFEAENIELELGMDITQATHANSSGGLLHAFLNRTKLAYQIVFPDTGTTMWTFDAYVEKFNLMADKEEHFKATVELKITGQPVLS